MPYGVKNKTKKWERTTKIGQKIDSRIESCVNKLLADPKFKPKAGRTKKESAIAVCKSTITEATEFKNQLEK